MSLVTWSEITVHEVKNKNQMIFIKAINLLFNPNTNSATIAYSAFPCVCVCVLHNWTGTQKTNVDVLHLPEHLGAINRHSCLVTMSLRDIYFSAQPWQRVFYANHYIH